jgi:hypothetical protein
LRGERKIWGPLEKTEGVGIPLGCGMLDEGCGAGREEGAGGGRERARIGLTECGDTEDTGHARAACSAEVRIPQLIWRSEEPGDFDW